ncbi:MAG: hypothetical protein MO852_08455 [Candidatus Devosia euplotis]|nr:hypothetical protein [Candidatus Devosia euplotis]
MGASTTKGFNAQGGSDADNGLMGAFSAMLGDNKQTSDVKGSAESKPEPNLSKLAALVLGADKGDEASKTTDDGRRQDAADRYGQ